MNVWHIETTREALKNLQKPDKPVRRRLQGAIDRLRNDPRPAGVVAMKGSSGHLRFRVGDWRVIYRVEDDRLVIVVVALGHRREVCER